MDEIKPFFKKIPHIVNASNQPNKQDNLKQSNFPDSLPVRAPGNGYAENQIRDYSSGAYMKFTRKILFSIKWPVAIEAWEWRNIGALCAAAA